MSGIFDQIINYAPPSLLLGTVTYKGTWSAATNTPTLVDPPSAITNGNYYVVDAAGTQFTLVFNIGDWIISNGSTWEKVDNTDAISSVFGRTGAVVGVSTDYSSVGITNTALGASNPSTVAATTVTATSTIAATGAVTGSNLSGTNTGDQTISLTGGVTGSGTGSFAATVVTNADLTGDVTSVGNATTLTNAPVIAKVLTGYSSGAGTVAATDSILQAIQKLDGNDSTNADLTGVITSSGNATSIASQTGTGTKFVVDTSPTLVTPNIGVATGTSLAAALNGSLGATTPSTIAATTGTFDAAGTADPAILVGAAGTGVNAGTVTLRGGSGTGGGGFVRFTKNATAKGYVGNESAINGNTSDDLSVYGVSNVRVYASNTQVGTFTSTGLNSTAIGATTPSTVAGTGFYNSALVSGEVFNATKSNAGYYVGVYKNSSVTGLGLFVQNGLDTNPAIRISNAAGSDNTIQLYGNGNGSFGGTLSASGTTTVGPNNAGTGVGLLQLLGGSGSNGGASVYFGTNGTAYSSIGQASGIVGGTSTDFVIYANNGSQNIKFYAGGSGNVATISATGLAVTGTLGTGDNITITKATSAALILDSTDNTTSDITQVVYRRNGTIKWRAGVNVGGTSTENYIIYSETAGAIATVSTTGAAITGTLSATGQISGTNTAAAQAKLSGYSTIGGTRAASGELFIGSGAGSTGGRLQYDDSGQTTFYLDNVYDHASSRIKVRMRTTGTPVTVLEVADTGLAVTGTLSTTGAISTAATGAALTLNSGDAATDTYMLLKRGSGTSWAIAHDSQGGLSFAKNLTDKAYFGRSGVDGLTVTGILSCTGALSKGSGSFRIEHPLPSKSATHQLVHSLLRGQSATSSIAAK
jgi:hypothetical protein